MTQNPLESFLEAYPFTLVLTLHLTIYYHILLLLMFTYQSKITSSISTPNKGQRKDRNSTVQKWGRAGGTDQPSPGVSCGHPGCWRVLLHVTRRTRRRSQLQEHPTLCILLPLLPIANKARKRLTRKSHIPVGLKQEGYPWILLKRGSLCQTALWPDLGRSFLWEKLRKPRLLMKAFFSFLVFVPSTDQALRSCVFPHFPQGTLSKTSPTTPHHNPPVTTKDPQLQGCSVDPAVHASDISSHKTRFLLEHSTIATPSEQLCSWDLCACPQMQKSYA